MEGPGKEWKLGVSRNVYEGIFLLITNNCQYCQFKIPCIIMVQGTSKRHRTDSGKNLGPCVKFSAEDLRCHFLEGSDSGKIGDFSNAPAFRV